MAHDDNYFVYMMTNKFRTVIYTGVTNSLRRRIYEHKYEPLSGFTKKYKVNRLVYVEILPSIMSAICREKQIKGGSRTVLKNALRDSEYKISAELHEA